jgi:hypothetical protein
MDKRNPGFAGYQKSLMDQFDDLHTALGYQCLSPAGLSQAPESSPAGDAKKIKIVNTTIFLSGGVFKSKSAAVIAFTATAHDIAADAATAQEAKYLVSLDAAGTPTITMGEIADVGESLLPDCPASKTPIGYVKIVVDAGSTKFDATSDDLDAGHLTATFYDFGGPYMQRFDAEQ